MKKMKMEPKTTKSKGTKGMNSTSSTTSVREGDRVADNIPSTKSLQELETILANHPFFLAGEQIDGSEPLPPSLGQDVFQLLQKYSLCGNINTALKLARKYMEDAVFQYKEGKYRIAATIFSEAIKYAEFYRHDRNLLANLYNYRGLCQMGIGNYGSGLKDFTNTLEFKPFAFSWKDAVECCLKLGKREEGLKVFEHGLQIGFTDKWELGPRLKKKLDRTSVNSEENSSASMSLRSPKNPFLIDSTVKSTLCNPSLNDLHSCRLVSQVWNKNSLPALGEKCPELTFIAGGTTNRGSRWTNHFHPTMGNSSGIPCSKFALRLEISNPDLSKFQELIDLCQSEVTSLHLYAVDSPPVEYLFGNPRKSKKSASLGPDTNKITFQKWLKDLKNLRKLTITDFDFGVLSSKTFFAPGYDLNLEKLQEFHFLKVGTEKKSSHFFGGFFLAAQNLKKMTFGIADYRQDYDYEELFNDSYEEMEQDESDDEEMFDDLDDLEQLATLSLNVVLNSFLNHGKLDGLRSLTFHLLNNVNLNTLVSMGKKGLKLQEFHVQGPRFGKIKFCEFLETQKMSLKTLIIKGEEKPRKTFSLMFPTEMKELRELELSTNGPLQIREAICYSTRFPKLEKLHVVSGHKGRNYRQNVEILDTFFTEDNNLIGCQTMKELNMLFTLSIDAEIDKDDIIERVSGIFPQMEISVDVQRAYDDDGGDVERADQEHGDRADDDDEEYGERADDDDEYEEPADDEYGELTNNVDYGELSDRVGEMTLKITGSTKKNWYW